MRDRIGTRLFEFLSTPSVRRATEAAVERYLEYEKFLSTPSVRRATLSIHQRHAHQKISIHALREEGDVRSSCKISGLVNFYPRPP